MRVFPVRLRGRPQASTIGIREHVGGRLLVRVAVIPIRSPRNSKVAGAANIELETIRTGDSRRRRNDWRPCPYTPIPRRQARVAGRVAERAIQTSVRGLMNQVVPIHCELSAAVMSSGRIQKGLATIFEPERI